MEVVMVESSMLTETIRDIVQHHSGMPTRLLQILRDVQDRLTWLSPETLERVAEELSISPNKVRSVAEF
ncbi:MAG TPA: hypothetical protein DEP36_12340, partial [Gammaproteobacteria bacterium]|nr:hypothetical protein [Gammaproteobacteria bacterium]